MTGLIWAFIFGALTVIALGAGLVAAYTSTTSITDVSWVGLVMLAFGVLVLVAMTWTTFIGAHYSYELDGPMKCTDDMDHPYETPQPYESLSKTGQEVFIDAYKSDRDTARSLDRATDFTHNTDYIQSISVVEYQGTCYGVDAWDGGLGFGAVLLIPPGLILGTVLSFLGVWELRSGWFRPVHLGPPIVGLLTVGVIYVLSDGGSTFGSLRGWIGMVVISIGAAVLWHLVNPIERILRQGPSVRDEKDR